MSDVNTDTGVILEALNDKADRDMNNVADGIDFVVESYQNGTEWYKLYKSGWCEQGGIAVQGSGGNVSVNLLKQFANTNYITVSNLNSTGGTGSYNPVVCVSKTTSTFQLSTWGDGTAGYNLGWKAVGYIS